MLICCKFVSCTRKPLWLFNLSRILDSLQKEDGNMETECEFIVLLWRMMIFMTVLFFHLYDSCITTTASISSKLFTFIKKNIEKCFVAFIKDVIKYITSVEDLLTQAGRTLIQ